MFEKFFRSPEEVVVFAPLAQKTGAAFAEIRKGIEAVDDINFDRDAWDGTMASRLQEAAKPLKDPFAQPPIIPCPEVELFQENFPGRRLSAVTGLYNAMRQLDPDSAERFQVTKELVSLYSSTDDLSCKDHILAALNAHAVECESVLSLMISIAKQYVASNSTASRKIALNTIFAAKDESARFICAAIDDASLLNSDEGRSSFSRIIQLREEPLMNLFEIMRKDEDKRAVVCAHSAATAVQRVMEALDLLAETSHGASSLRKIKKSWKVSAQELETRLAGVKLETDERKLALSSVNDGNFRMY